MSMKSLDRFSMIAAVVLLVLVIAACTIHLRGDEHQISPSMSADQTADPPAPKLAQCGSVTYDQKDALVGCRKAWAEQRRQFLERQAPSTTAGSEASRQGSSLFVPARDDSRVPGSPSIPKAKE